VGDVTGIRERIDYGRKANQKLHQWCYSKFAAMLGYKARLHGMTVKRVGEAYTSQSCPECQHRKKPKGREYHCSECGFEGHRDVVGAANIRTKYQGEIPVAGAMASPTGVRYDPHMRCNPLSGHQTSSEAATLKRERAAQAA
jgi:putative transposase